MIFLELNDQEPRIEAQMKNSKLKNTINSFLLLTYFTTLAVTFGNVVLCQGNDGHVAIEFANGGHCTELPNEISDSHEHSRSADQSLIACELSHCGDCEDMPLVFSSNDGFRKSITLSKFSAQRPSTCWFTIYSQQKSLTTASLPRTSLFSNFPFILSNIILLI